MQRSAELALLTPTAGSSLWAGPGVLLGGTVPRFGSTSQQSCTVLPGCSVNCWADLKHSRTQSSSLLPALKQRNSVASKPLSNQMSQPSPPERWKKPVTVITVIRAPTSSLKLHVQMPSDRQMFPIRNTTFPIASGCITHQDSIASAFSGWSIDLLESFELSQALCIILTMGPRQT